MTNAEQFRVRVLHEAVSAGFAHTWRRRAEALELARPRSEDFTGDATQADLRAQDERLREKVRACLRRAQMSDLDARAMYESGELEHLMDLA